MPTALSVDPSEVQSIAVDPSEVSDVQPKGVISTITDASKRALGATWEWMNPMTLGPALGHAIVHPLDTLSNIQEQVFGENGAVARTSHALAQGDLKEAAMSSAGMVPIPGAPFEQILREIDAGQYPEAIGHAAALRIIAESPKIAKAAPEAIAGAAGTMAEGARAVANFPSKVVSIAKTPGVPKMATGGTLAAGGLSELAQFRPWGAYLLAKGMDRFASGYAEYRASQTAPPPILDDLANSLAGKDFDNLTPDAQAQVRQIADRIHEKAPPPKPQPTGPGPIDLGPPAAETHTTPYDMVTQELERRRAAAAQPAPTTPRIPIWQRQARTPAETPPEAAPAPSMPVALPSGRVPGGMPTETPAPVSSGVHPPSEAYEKTFQAKRAKILASFFHGDHPMSGGQKLSYEDVRAITPEMLAPEQWRAILGKDPETGYQYHEPSQSTLDQAAVRVQHKYHMERNLQRDVGPQIEAVKGLQNEPHVGSTVTFKNGETGIIKSIAPDGTVDYE